MAGSVSVAATGNQDINGLLSGLAWNTKDLTFSFPAQSSFYATPYGLAEPGDNFGSLSSVQRAAALKAFDMIAAVTDLTFTEIKETSSVHADIRLASADIDAPAWTYFPGDTQEAGDTWFKTSGGTFDDPRLGSYAFYVFIHEILHGVGLKHGNEEGGYGAMTTAHDSMEFSATTYRSYVGATGTYVENEPWGYAQGLMMYDIAALQHMYGADYTSQAGNTVYRWSPTAGELLVNGVSQGTPGANRVFQTIWDGGGNDYFDFSRYTSDLSVDLRPGRWIQTSDEQTAELGFLKYARGNIANSMLHNGDLRSLIENAVGGAGDDRIIGNVAANLLRGKGGADRIYGMEGNDVLSGGAGRDVLTGGLGKDSILFDRKPSKINNMDRITDFRAVDDTIRLENSIFTKAGAVGKLKAAAFWKGAAAHDASDRVIYDPKTGVLYYDADGTGKTPQVQFAQVSKGLKLTTNDFFMV